MSKPQTIRISLVLPLTRRTIAALSALRAATASKQVTK